MKPDCRNHKKEVAGFSDMKALAKMITDLHYESLAELLEHVAGNLQFDGKKDCRAGRISLGYTLQDISLNIQKATTSAYKAWNISKPFMPGAKGKKLS